MGLMKRLLTDLDLRRKYGSRFEFQSDVKCDVSQEKESVSMVATATAGSPANTGQAQKQQPISQQMADRPRLWKQPIEVIGLTGEFASGKTLFGLTICPGPETRVYDTEKSCGTYLSLGFDRVDMTKECLGMDALGKFNWWRKSILAIPVGKFRVLMLDTVSEIESGLAEYVRRNPQEFGYTTNQFEKASGLFWGAVKDFWKSILSDLSARCETFVFTSHLREEFVNGRPTGKRIAKGKDTLMELASLYLHMERIADKKGVVPDRPAAIVLKSRLATINVNEAGEVETIPTLPPRIPEATPKAIRAYMDSPPDYSKLKAGEKIIEREMSEDERANLKLQTAQAELEAEQLKTNRLEQARIAAQRLADAKAARPSSQPAQIEPKQNQPLQTLDATEEQFQQAVQMHAEAEAAADQLPEAVSHAQGPLDEQLDAIVDYRDRLKALPAFGTEDLPEDFYAKAIAKRGVKSARELSQEQASELIEKLRTVLLRLGGADAENAAEKNAKPGGVPF